MTASAARVLVTAGASGIGRAISEAFLAEGALVHICDIDEKVLREFCGQHNRLEGSVVDVANADDVDTLLDDFLVRQGGIDVLVNNAGVAGPTAPVEAISYADWRHCLAVNLDAAYLCARRAAPSMKAQGAGSIVNISSTAGFMGYPLRTPYAAAKWALIGLTKSLAMELGPYGIRVNAVCPGPVQGDRMQRIIASEAEATGKDVEEVAAAYVRSTSLRTFIEAADIAATVSFLCSPAGAKITGQAVPVDGHTESLTG
ncbi:MAG: SDR family oxidoreductase [Alphaproteobacteria bacterium]|nr:SDR family oxidoreductase [Alphaproteobacteria bacterium]